MFTLLCMLVGWLIRVDFIVMFLPSKDDTPVDMPTPGRTFSQFAFLSQHLCTSGPPLGRAVKLASVWMSSSLSRYVTVGKAKLGKFNFGVGMGGGG